MEYVHEGNDDRLKEADNKPSATGENELPAFKKG